MLREHVTSEYAYQWYASFAGTLVRKRHRLVSQDAGRSQTTGLRRRREHGSQRAGTVAIEPQREEQPAESFSSRQAHLCQRHSHEWIAESRIALPELLGSMLVVGIQQSCNGGRGIDFNVRLNGIGNCSGRDGYSSRPFGPYGPPPVPFGHPQIPYGVPPPSYGSPFIPPRPRTSERSHSPPDSTRRYIRVAQREKTLRRCSEAGCFSSAPVVPLVYGTWFSSNSGGHHKSGSNMVDQATLDKLDAGFKKLQDAKDCKSLLKKYLTKDVFEKLKTRKTAMGATLLDVIQSGVENLDSGVGLYAPDAESYTLFADLFNPVIEDYHGGFKATDKHPPTDFGDLNTLVNVDPEDQFVISTRVRCGRSLQGYPFNPCLTEAQYREMEEKVSSTLRTLEGELKGTYYPLTGMDKKTQQQLIDDHFLFKEGDRFLQAANACRYWPTGRGIYHNDAKTFLVWCNEEDHLRIISMQKGGDLKEVFGRLVKAVNSIEAKLPFSRDSRLGFLTFCPTNLGTTIRASVHIKVPKLAADKAKLESIAAKYNLQVRGTRGEHTESEGGVYDISNKRRMGLTEYQAVKEMQDGILELIRLEKAA
ncbi:hypothetical protein HPB47_008469 [Ixodes persulcatus]|uniref:Uncharacterized protein n=1 Tax=Ixodes persulcatus TaxID=34615 RepID=A0AC60P4J1_IXOPE|nr:hypothetical protein HPB47_008469 [Ixodes persulcatus]